MPAITNYLNKCVTGTVCAGVLLNYKGGCSHGRYLMYLGCKDCEDLLTQQFLTPSTNTLYCVRGQRGGSVLPGSNPECLQCQIAASEYLASMVYNRMTSS